MDMRIHSKIILLTLCFFGLPFASARADEELDERYIRALRNRGYADLAIEYLRAKLEKPGVTAEQRASYEFDIASALIDSGQTTPDLSLREQRLEEARRRFEDFAKKNPSHPRRPESLSEIALVDLQRGRLKVLLAQLPANASQAGTLVEEARKLLAESSKTYAEAYQQFRSVYDQLPVYIPDVSAEDRALRKRKDRMYYQMMEARFQTALTKFYLADSYKTVETLDAAGKPIPATGNAAVMQEAEKELETIYTEYRQFPAGQIANLWRARCMAARGEHTQARAILNHFMKHDNPALKPMQRIAFWFMMLSYAAENQPDQVVNLAEPWLIDRENARARREPAYLGVEMELARAYLARANAAKDDRSRNKELQEADKRFGRLAASANEYQGLAIREKMKIEERLNRDVNARGFGVLTTRANAKLDELRPEMPPETRKALLREVIRMFHEALAAVDSEDDPSAVSDTWLQLMYAYDQLGLYYATAILGESFAQQHPTSPAAPQAEFFGVLAYARGFDDAVTQGGGGQPRSSDVDADHLLRLTMNMQRAYPQSAFTDQARLVAANLELHASRKNFDSAAEILNAVSPDFAQYPEALSLAGQSYWSSYVTKVNAGGANANALKEIRKQAIEKLSAASPLLHKWTEPRAASLTFINDSTLGEALYDANEDAKSLAILDPLVAQIADEQVPENVEPSRRLGVLLTALQANIRSNNLGATDRLIDLIGKQRGSSEAANVTATFLSLAARVKEQIDRFEATGDEGQRQQTIAAFEGFLNKLAARDAGQTLQSRIYLGDMYFGIQKYSKARETLEKALASPEATDPKNAPLVARGEMLMAQAESKLGRHADARKRIDKLYLQNGGVLEVMMLRGDILEQADSLNDAIIHWKSFLKTAMRTSPRPDQFYQVVDRLVGCFERSPPETKKSRLAEGRKYLMMILNTDPSLPPEWRTRFEAKKKELDAALKLGAG